MPSHPDRVRQNYDPDVLVPIEVPDSEIEIEDLPLERPSETTDDDTEPGHGRDLRAGLCRRAQKPVLSGMLRVPRPQ